MLLQAGSLYVQAQGHVVLRHTMSVVLSEVLVAPLDLSVPQSGVVAPMGRLSVQRISAAAPDRSAAPQGEQNAALPVVLVAVLRAASRAKSVVVLTVVAQAHYVVVPLAAHLE